MKIVTLSNRIDVIRRAGFTTVKQRHSQHTLINQGISIKLDTQKRREKEEKSKQKEVLREYAPDVSMK